MTESSTQLTTPWRLDGSHAILDCGALRATIDVAASGRGLSGVRYRGAAIEGWLLGVEVEHPAPPSDVYVRGDDLVATYRETPQRPFSVQICWSAQFSDGGDSLILDATVSIQTRQWEAYPRVTVVSSLGSGEVVTLRETGLVTRPTGAAWSYVEVTAPEDFAIKAPIGELGSAGAGWSFGGQFMERGVIRRLRLRGAFVPRTDDLAAAARLQVALIAEPPRLTT